MQSSSDPSAGVATLPEAAAEHLGRIASEFGAEALPFTQDGIHAFRLGREAIRGFLQALRDDGAVRYRLLLDVTAVDLYGREPRFDVVYHLYSFDLNRRLRVKVSCGERDARVPSVVPVFPTAGFLEREVFDMFGIRFDGHPNMQRILMPAEYEHHPLRKDFPLEGIHPEKVYRAEGGVMMPRPGGAEPINGARSDTP